MPTEPDDAGVTLLEVVTAMTVMSIFGSLFIGAVAQMYSAIRGAEAAAGVQSQVAIAYQRLDAEIRYAKGFTTPGPATGTDRHVEYLVANAGAEWCGALRLQGSTGQLQWRRWTRGSTPGQWTVLASDVSAGTPFTVVPPAAGSRNQTLTLSLTVVQHGRSRQLQTTFVALNSTRTDDSATVCVEGRSTP